eukprot:358735-Chlamydomonas_euryale.AAC.6
MGAPKCEARCTVGHPFPHTHHSSAEPYACSKRAPSTCCRSPSYRGPAASHFIAKAAAHHMRAPPGYRRLVDHRRRRVLDLVERAVEAVHGDLAVCVAEAVPLGRRVHDVADVVLEVVAVERGSVELRELQVGLCTRKVPHVLGVKTDLRAHGHERVQRAWCCGPVLHITLALHADVACVGTAGVACAAVQCAWPAMHVDASRCCTAL